MSGPITETDAAYVRELVLRRAAIHLDASKQYLLENRLEQAAKERGLPGARELVAQSRSGQAALDTVIIEALTTHETSFFRDLTPFETLRLELLPALIRERERTRTLCFWSAACSTGQEPYSIAMMLLHHFPQLATWRISIVATDLSEQVLAKARAGVFRQLDVNRGLPAAMLVKHFTRVGADWVINPNVRAMVEFRQVNLLAPWTGVPRPDVAFLRNVLIYFEPETRRTILGRMRNLLGPSGILFLGAAETTMGLDDGWDRLPVKASCYRVRP
jgi:chemotaxis protein methyltransferase CheR